MLFMVHSHHCSISKGKWPSTTSYTRWNNLWNSTDKNEKQHWFKLISLKPFSDHMHVYLQCLSFSTISKWQQFNSNLIVKKRTRSQSSIATKRGRRAARYSHTVSFTWQYDWGSRRQPCGSLQPQQGCSGLYPSLKHHMWTWTGQTLPLKAATHAQV